MKVQYVFALFGGNDDEPTELVEMDNNSLDAARAAFIEMDEEYADSWYYVKLIQILDK